MNIASRLAKLEATNNPPAAVQIIVGADAEEVAGFEADRRQRGIIAMSDTVVRIVAGVPRSDARA